MGFGSPKLGASDFFSRAEAASFTRLLHQLVAQSAIQTNNAAQVQSIGPPF